MEYNKIRELLARYWEGTSSLEEEDILRRFFTEAPPQLPPDLLEAQPLFQYFAAEAATGWPEEAATGAVIIPMPPARQRPWEHWMKFAAIFLVAIGIGYAGRQVQEKQEHIAVAQLRQDTYSDPAEAYAATQKALRLLARNLNKGTEQVQKLTYFSDATEKIKAN